MSLLAFAGPVIWLILGIALVLVSNRDYNDGQCRSKTWSRVLGILYILGSAVMIGVLFYYRNQLFQSEV